MSDELGGQSWRDLHGELGHEAYMKKRRETFDVEAAPLAFKSAVVTLERRRTTLRHKEEAERVEAIKKEEERSNRSLPTTPNVTRKDGGEMDADFPENQEQGRMRHRSFAFLRKGPLVRKAESLPRSVAVAAALGDSVLMSVPVRAGTGTKSLPVNVRPPASGREGGDESRLELSDKSYSSTTSASMSSDNSEFHTQSSESFHVRITPDAGSETDMAPVTKLPVGRSKHFLSGTSGDDELGNETVNLEKLSGATRMSDEANLVDGQGSSRPVVSARTEQVEETELGREPTDSAAGEALVPTMPAILLRQATADNSSPGSTSLEAEKGKSLLGGAAEERRVSFGAALTSQAEPSKQELTASPRLHEEQAHPVLTVHKWAWVSAGGCVAPNEDVSKPGTFFGSGLTAAVALQRRMLRKRRQSTAKKASWRKDILQALKDRNAREVEAFRELAESGEEVRRNCFFSRCWKLLQGTAAHDKVVLEHLFEPLVAV